MSEVKVNKISPRTNCGTTQLGDVGDTITVTGDLKSNSLKPATGTTLTLGASGDTITLAAGASQSGFGRTGTVDWDTTAKTASFTAVSGNGYFVNTTSGAITVTLPAGSAGDIVSLADYAATWQTNSVTISPNGTDKIGGVNTNAVLNTEGQSVTFVYSDSTQGWLNTMDSTSNVRASAFIQATGGTITTCGNCKIHTFTGPGTFCVAAISSNCVSENIVSYMVIAGGGGGAKCTPQNRQGGGGAGGYREVKNPITCYSASPLNGYCTPANRVTITATSYPIVVGAGGAGKSGPGGDGTRGSDSTFSSITSTAGGAGQMGPGLGNPLAHGGSGGASSGNGPSDCVQGGTGNTPPVSPPQGNNGGNGAQPDAGGGGGGGAGGAGSNGSPSKSAVPGGAGTPSSISTSPVTYSGGGPSNGGASGSTNSGEGGAGAPGDAGNGGSGIVIIRYKYQ